MAERSQEALRALAAGINRPCRAVSVEVPCSDSVEDLRLPQSLATAFGSASRASARRVRNARALVPAQHTKHNPASAPVTRPTRRSAP